jgi:hypothetical protein
MALQDDLASVAVSRRGGRDSLGLSDRAADARLAALDPSRDALELGTSPGVADVKE